MNKSLIKGIGLMLLFVTAYSGIASAGSCCGCSGGGKDKAGEETTQTEVEDE